MISLDLQRPPNISDAQWRKMLMQVLAQAKAATPVRTGRLKAGWQLLGDALVNEVPYAEFVNDGTPRMAPRNMTGRALSALR